MRMFLLKRIPDWNWGQEEGWKMESKWAYGSVTETGDFIASSVLTDYHDDRYVFWILVWIVASIILLDFAHDLLDFTHDVAGRYTGRQHRGCIIPRAVTRSLVFLKMCGIIARNMLSWLELLINRYFCI